MVPKPFQAVDTKQRWKKKIVGAYRELERTRQERDILKKTVSIFSHEQL
jgi:hypothetical protein